MFQIEYASQGPPPGNSGHKVPYLDGVNTWSAAQTITVTDVSAPLTLISTDAGAVQFPFDLYRNSPSPAAADAMSIIRYVGMNSSAAQINYVVLQVKIDDPTAGSEDATLNFNIYAAGTQSFRMGIAQGVFVGGVTGGDKGAGSLNAVTLYENGTALTAKYGQLAGTAAYTANQTINIGAGGGPALTLLTSLSAQNSMVPLLAMTSTDSTAPAGTAGPVLTLTRDKSTVAAADFLGSIRYDGRNSANVLLSYVRMYAVAVSPTSGAEYGELRFDTVQNGTRTSSVILGQGVYHPSATGTDKGNNTLNFGTLYENGTSLFNTYATLAGGNAFTGLQSATTATISTTFQALSTDAGALAFSGFETYRNSASPAALDYLGQLPILGRNSTPAAVSYFWIDAQIQDPTAGSEDTQVRLVTYAAGAAGSRLVITQGLWHGSASGSDKGNGTINFVTLYENGTSLAAKYAQLAVSQTFTAAQVIRSAGVGTLFSVVGTDPGTQGPSSDIYHDSVSPAVSDTVASLRFLGRESATNAIAYGQISVIIADPTDLAESSIMYFYGQAAGQFVNPLMVQGNGNLSITSIDAGAAAGPYLDVSRTSASPAAADSIGIMRFIGRNTTPTALAFFQLYGVINDPTAAGEDSSIYFTSYAAGATAVRLTIGSTGGVFVGAPTGGDKGVNTFNVTTLYEAGTLLTAKYGQLAGTAAYTANQTINTGAVAGYLLTMTSSDPALTGVNFLLDRPSASPAVGDTISSTVYQGRNSTNGVIGYGQTFCYITDPTATSEDSNLYLYLQNAGVSSQAHVFVGTGQITHASNDPGAAAAPILDLSRIGGSPAAADVLGQIRFVGQNSTPSTFSVAQIYATLSDPTAASEDASLTFTTYLAGANGVRLTIGSLGGVYIGAPTGTDKGAATLNATTLYEAGTSLAAKYGQLTAANTWTAFQNFTSATASANNVTITNTDAGAAAAPLFDLTRTGGSPAAADIMASIRFLGQDSALAGVVYGQLVISILDPTAGSIDAAITISRQVAGTNTAGLTLGLGFQLGVPAGGDKGLGTLNVQAGIWSSVTTITSNSSPASRAFRETGRVELAKWDALAEGGVNEGARYFQTMLDDGFDPRHHRAFTRKFRDDEMLPGYFPLKEWSKDGFALTEMTGRLLLAADILGLGVASLSDEVTDHDEKIASLEATIASLQTRIQQLETRH